MALSFPSAMILAAGRGERMRPLTDTVPKPLIPIHGIPLIGWHLKHLAAANITNVVINHAWLGSQIETHLQQASGYGTQIRYSRENPALETAGGIAQAMTLLNNGLGEMPFIVISADIFTDYPYAHLINIAQQLASDPKRVAHLVLAPTTRYSLDFDLDKHDDDPNGIVNTGIVNTTNTPRYTYANIAVIKPALVASVKQGSAAKLGPLLKQFAAAGLISGEIYEGLWLNVGTIEDIALAESQSLSQK